MASSIARQQEIQRALKLLNLMNQSMDDYLFIIDYDTQLCYFASDEISEKYCLPQASLGIPVDEWCNAVHSRDLPALREDLRRTFSGELEEHHMEYRMLARNGRRYWVNGRAKLHLDANGQPLMLMGRVSDTVLRQKLDPLTGLLNETKYLKDIASAIRSPGAKGHLIIFGLDDFKNINIKYGRQFGDQVLLQITQALQQLVSDSLNLYRLEGDRFGLILTHSTPNDVEAFYRQLCKLTADICAISAGAAAYVGAEVDGETLFLYAENSLDRAKKLGKNMLVFFTPEFYQESHNDIDLLLELRRSVQLGFEGFFLCYQPQVETASCRIRGVEALLRFRSPHRGIVGPDDFIPLLEKTGLINPVGEWVLKEALDQCRKWRAHLPQLRISANLSYVQFKQPDFSHRVVQIFQQSGLPAGTLTLEITEGIQLQDYYSFNRVFQDWSKAGIEVSIDDFGTGYSSLGYLKNINIDEVKIDRSFVRDIQYTAYNYQLLKNIIELTQSSRIRVCCEGVETREELSVLQGLSPDFLQGFLFSKPCSTQEFEDLYLTPDTPSYRKRLEIECCCANNTQMQRLPDPEAEATKLHTILENIDEPVCVTHPETRELYYTNAEFRRLTGAFDHRGHILCQLLCGRNAPCGAYVPASQLNDDDYAVSDVFSPALHHHFQTKEKYIRWGQGRARLTIILDKGDESIS